MMFLTVLVGLRAVRRAVQGRPAETRRADRRHQAARGEVPRPNVLRHHRRWEVTEEFSKSRSEDA